MFSLQRISQAALLLAMPAIFFNAGMAYACPGHDSQPIEQKLTQPAHDEKSNTTAQPKSRASRHVGATGAATPQTNGK
ncbi:hypothetical protein [Pandoraea sp.]|uniref:hypothetical protein n=1 Tax=Pandoraea sp. TaxID=1883445 RepID=UPI0012163456|nr:hypothetical protein [Pandoraea sp.]TAL53589.1 MAG: hypothetical protein EPN80_14995 [Pandoraea sp.]TAM14868.1 MAG: hypothetical protein EPN65_20045 [Pandoraea sp.]